MILHKPKRCFLGTCLKKTKRIKKKVESKAGKSTEGLEAARGKKGEGSTAKFMLGFLQRMGMMSIYTCEDEQITKGLL